MGTAYDSFQVHTCQPDGGTGQTSVIAEIYGKLLDEVGGKFFDKRSDFVGMLKVDLLIILSFF